MDDDLLRLAATNALKARWPDMLKEAEQIRVSHESVPLSPYTDQTVFVCDKEGHPLCDLGYIYEKRSRDDHEDILVV